MAIVLPRRFPSAISRTTCVVLLCNVAVQHLAVRWHCQWEGQYEPVWDLVVRVV